MQVLQKLKGILFFIIAVLIILPIIGCTYEPEVSTNSQGASNSNIAESTDNSSESRCVSDGAASVVNSQAQSVASESEVVSETESTEASETSSKPFVKREGVLYLTFDDGPHPKNTIRVLDMLQKHGIKATFFVIGDWAKLYPDIIKRMDSEGHAIACHSMTHKTSVIYKSIKSFESDLDEWERTIKNILGELPEYLVYRFPGGSTNSNKFGLGKELVQFVKDRNYTVYDWNASNGDRWAGGKKENESTDEYLRRLIIETVHSCDRSKDPCVVLMHDSAKETVDMLEWALETLITEGYGFDNLYGLNHSVVFKMK